MVHLVLWQLNRNARFLMLATISVSCIFSCTIFTACQTSQGITTNAVTRANAKSKRELGTFSPVEGTSYLRAAITSGGTRESSSSGSGYGYSSGGGYGSGSGKGSGLNFHNYVFINTADDSAWRLMTTNDSLILAESSSPEKREGEKTAIKGQWILYNLVKADTNGDKELSYQDRRTLAVSDAGGKGFTEVISDIELIFGQTWVDSTTLVIIYLKDSKKYYTKIDLPSRQATLTKELPALGDDVE